MCVVKKDNNEQIGNQGRCFWCLWNDEKYIHTLLRTPYSFFRHDFRKSWKIIKETGKHITNDIISGCMINGILTSDPFLISNALNTYLFDIGPLLAIKIKSDITIT